MRSFVRLGSFRARRARHLLHELQADKDGRARPALGRGPLETQEEMLQTAADKKKELHPSKVRAVIICDECKRPRCIFAKTQPGVKQLGTLDAYTELAIFTCGSPLFSNDVDEDLKPLAEKFYNRERLSCRDDMELQYFNYGGLRGRSEFDHVCARCGQSDAESDLLVLPADFVKLGVNLQGKTPLPLCLDCKGKKLQPVLVLRSNKVMEDLERRANKATAKWATPGPLPRGVGGPF